MPKDDLEILEALISEFCFIGNGGYRRSTRTPWAPRSMFQDSPICLNHGDESREHSCEDCVLFGFVPLERQSEAVPCHHIPLSERGETVDGLERESQRRLEDATKVWLSDRIEEKGWKVEESGPEAWRPRGGHE